MVFVGFLFVRTHCQNFTGISDQNSPECHRNFARISNWSTLKQEKGGNHNSAFPRMVCSLLPRAGASHLHRGGTACGRRRRRLRRAEGGVGSGQTSIGTFACTGWSFIGNTLSNLTPRYVRLNKYHTKTTPIIGKTHVLNHKYINKAPTHKGNNPYETWGGPNNCPETRKQILQNITTIHLFPEQLRKTNNPRKSPTPYNPPPSEAIPKQVCLSLGRASHIIYTSFQKHPNNFRRQDNPRKRPTPVILDYV